MLQLKATHTTTYHCEHGLGAANDDTDLQNDRNSIVQLNEWQRIRKEQALDDHRNLQSNVQEEHDGTELASARSAVSTSQLLTEDYALKYRLSSS